MTFFEKYFIEDCYIERSKDRVLFIPDGKFTIGDVKAYVIRTDHELKSIYSFLKKDLIDSSLMIIFTIIAFSASALLITHIGGIILSSIILIYYARHRKNKINNFFKESEATTCDRDIDFFWFFKIWRVWLFSILLLVVSIALILIIGRIMVSI